MLTRIWNYFTGYVESSQPTNTFQAHPGWIKHNEQRASLEARDENYNTPLILAIAAGENGYAAELLDAGAYIEARGNFGFTPLAVAAILGNAEAVQMLLARGANKEVVTYERARRPLAWAVHEGFASVVKLLYDAGADVHALDSDGQTPLTLAQHFQDDVIIQILNPPVPAPQRVPATPVSAASPAPATAITIDTEFSDDDEDLWQDPVTMATLEDPVTVPSGYTYSRSTLIEWFKQKGNPERIPCPMTRVDIPVESLSWGKNHLIDEAMKKNRANMAALAPTTEDARSVEMTSSKIRDKRLRFFGAGEAENLPKADSDKRIKLANNGRL